MDKKCSVCNEKAKYYWVKPSGRIELCFEHYEAMERMVHEKEKVRFMFNFIGSGSMEIVKCPNGKDCKYCMELAQPPKDKGE